MKEVLARKLFDEVQQIIKEALQLAYSADNSSSKAELISFIRTLEGAEKFLLKDIPRDKSDILSNEAIFDKYEDEI